MKKTKVLLLSLGMALCIGGGIGSAFAITRTAAGNTGTGDFDKAINLYWGSKQSTATLTDMDELSVDVAQYRYLSVTPESSKSVTGTVTVSFTLAKAADNEQKSYDIEGITVKVFETTSLATDETVAELIAGKEAKTTITKLSPTGSASFAVSSSTAVHETNAYYAIQVVYDGSQQPAGKELGGQLTIVQSFAVGS